MPIQQQTLKIRPDHLTRNAVIYVRQSTLLQVRENIGSTRASMTWSSARRIWDGNRQASRLLTRIKDNRAPRSLDATVFNGWWPKWGWAMWEPS